MSHNDSYLCEVATQIIGRHHLVLIFITVELWCPAEVFRLRLLRKGYIYRLELRLNLKILIKGNLFSLSYGRRR